MDFKIKYLKYKQKYVDLKSNGPSDKIISYRKHDGKDFFNTVTITSSRTNSDSTTQYKGRTTSGNEVSLNSINENNTWFRINKVDSKEFSSNEPVQQLWNKHNQQKSSTTYDIKVNINLPVIMNQAILDRIDICRENGGTIDHTHHLTLYSGTTNNFGDLKTITNNSKSIKENFLNICQNSDDTGSGRYKILGQNLPDKVKQIINYGDDLNLIATHGTENNGGKGVFLVKVFFGNDVDFSEVYELLRQNNNLVDTNLYTREKYTNFTLHLSLAKFENVKQALDALYVIYSSSLPSGFSNYFKDKSNFAKHLNISIN